MHTEKTKLTSFYQVSWKAYVYLNWCQLRDEATSQFKQSFNSVRITRKYQSMLFNTKNYQI